MSGPVGSTERLVTVSATDTSVPSMDRGGVTERSAGDRQLGAVDHERGHDQSGEHQAAGASEIDAAEQQSAHERRQPCGEQAPPASGESGAQPLDPG